jgi:ferric-dicitrate binding protein FerR (iron transport regulator)
MQNRISPELLERYLNGKATPHESDLVEQWYTSFDEEKEDALVKEDIVKEKMLSQIKSRLGRGGNVSPQRNLPFQRSTLRWAATISILMVIGASFYFFLTVELPPTATVKNDIVPAPTLERFVNTSELKSSYQLSDGSEVVLQPNSSIEFPSIFSPYKREVKLTGEAFFDVTKDKNRPFVIRTGDVTIKVLGTSFNVKAYQGASEIRVAVKTGKVMVSKSENTITLPEENDAIILTPNQEVVYNTADENFQRKLVDVPAIILAAPTLFKMKYEETPVDEIFEVLEENYGIDIVYDQPTLSGCTLTTSMAEEGLYERIEIICKAIGAQYEITDTMILVTSAGCR